MLNAEEFVSLIKKHIKVKNEEVLKKAFLFSEKAHQNQKRDSGEPYFIHPLSIAIETSEYKLDEDSVIAALLHDTVEDTTLTINDIEKFFGSNVAYLVDGLTKIDTVKFRSKTEKNAENFRKLLLATAKDIRVLVIKLLDRLDNMRTIFGIKDLERRERITNETLMIFVPLAERIGMYKLKLELEDLCFRVLFPTEREAIVKNIKKTKKNEKNIIDDILKKLALKVTFENHINCKIFGREKRPYSIWKKMHKKSVSFEKLKDIIAFRIIVKNLQDCYKVLGCLNSNYIMVPNTFKDYISKPKLNGYQSLHIVIIGPKNIKIEVQIRTEEMNRVAEYGVASHWLYKQNIKKEDSLNKYNILKTLVQNLENSEYSSENFEDIKYELYDDEIFCYTPMGDIINLPIGSTGIDFAYAIHRDIGNRCCGVKVNGNLIQLKKPLNSGDEVEIVTAKTIQVHEEWLSFVKTAKAKAEIKVYIRNSRQKEFEKIGREEIKNLSSEIKFNIDDELIEKNISKFNNIKSVNELYALVAQGKLKKKELVKVLFPELERDKAKINLLNEKDLLKIKISNPQNSFGIQGLDKNVAYKYAKCCYPIPPNEIVGVVNSGTGITVHRKDCKLLQAIEYERIIGLEWDNNNKSKYIARILLTFESIPGVLAKVVNLCSEKKINIIGLTTLNESEFYQELELKIEVANTDELENFEASLRGIKGIMDIK